jgi:hypothetical protein
MGKKIRAAQASLVAAFLAAGGAAAATAGATDSATSDEVIRGVPLTGWGDPLIGLIKLDGFPAYMKYDGSELLALSYKGGLLADADALYAKTAPLVYDLLSLYQKAYAGPLAGILIGLEAYAKEGNLEPLLSYLESSRDALAAYQTFATFFSALKEVSGEGGAFEFFGKETGIVDLPAVQIDEIG